MRNARGFAKEQPCSTTKGGHQRNGMPVPPGKIPHLILRAYALAVLAATLLAPTGGGLAP